MCHDFYTTVEGFSCAEVGCAVRSALLEFQAHLFFCWCFFNYSISFLKPIRLRHQSMDCCSPCRPLLPFWLGKGMATPLRCSLDSARFGFSLWASIICHPSQCFLLSVSTFLASLPIPSHPISAALSHAWMGGVVVPFPSQREGST